MRSPVTIDVSVACPGWREACLDVEGLVRDVGEHALRRGIVASGLEWRGPLELGITLADAAEQQRLNRNYRGEDRPTNVLAFSAWEAETSPPSGAPVLLGDVVLGFEVLLREATEQAKPFADHLIHLTVHGVLHLLGFDHLTATEAEVMESLERAILTEMGVPDPYRDTMSLSEPAPVQK
jgi:probable rRNA maturation factor